MAGQRDKTVEVFRRAAHRQMWDMAGHAPGSSLIAVERAGTLHRHLAVPLSETWQAFRQFVDARAIWR
jgi:hypothetical protein